MYFWRTCGEGGELHALLLCHLNPLPSLYMFSFWIAVSFPGLVSDSGHDGARLCPYWRNLPLLYGVSGLKKVCYIGFPVGSIARVAEQVLWGVVKVSCPLGKKKKNGKTWEMSFYSQVDVKAQRPSLGPDLIPDWEMAQLPKKGPPLSIYTRTSSKESTTHLVSTPHSHTHS